MKFIISQSQIHKALSICSKALDDGRIIPIMSCFCFDINNTELEISACNLKFEVKTSLMIESKITQKICIPGAKLKDYISKCTDQPLTFEIVEHSVKQDDELGQFESVTYSINVHSSAGKCSLPCDDGRDMPSIKNTKPKQLTIPAENFLEIIQKTSFAISDDDLRPVFTGIYFQIAKNKLTATATDGNCLSTYSYAVDCPDASFIIPKNTIKQIQSLNPFGELKLSVGTSVGIEWDGVKTTSVLIDEKFPDYLSVIPTDNPISFNCNRIDLQMALRRVVSFGPFTRCVKLDVGKTLTLLAENTDLSEDAKEEVIGNLTGEPILIGVNGDSLIEMLNSFTSEDICLAFSSPNRAVIITDEKWNGEKENLELLMPMILY